MLSLFEPCALGFFRIGIEGVIQACEEPLRQSGAIFGRKTQELGFKPIEGRSHRS